MEQWKDIPGYEGIYQASNEGRIRTSENKTTSNALCDKRVWKQRVLKQIWVKRPRSDKYQANVKLWKDGKVQTYLVARLIAMTWCDGYADDLTVNHIDGDPTNNRADNLEWITKKENIQKGFEAGLYKSCKPVRLIAKDGTVQTFISMTSAGKFLGKSRGYLQNRIQSGKREACGYTIA